MFCFFVSYFPVIKKLSSLFFVCRIIQVSFQLWEHNIRAALKISVQCSASRVQSPASNVQSPASSVQRPECSVQSPASRVQRPASRVQRPESSVQSPVFNSCVQSPGIPVCLTVLLFDRISQFTYSIDFLMFSVCFFVIPN